MQLILSTIFSKRFKINFGKWILLLCLVAFTGTYVYNSFFVKEEVAKAAPTTHVNGEVHIQNVSLGKVHKKKFISGGSIDDFSFDYSLDDSPTFVRFKDSDERWEKGLKQFGRLFLERQYNVSLTFNSLMLGYDLEKMRKDDFQVNSVTKTITVYSPELDVHLSFPDYKKLEQKIGWLQLFLFTEDERKNIYNDANNYGIMLIESDKDIKGISKENKQSLEKLKAQIKEGQRVNDESLKELLLELPAYKNYQVEIKHRSEKVHVIR